jgi:hypothetical protein
MTTPPRSIRRARHRRAVILFLTLVVITIAALAGTTMLLRADAERAHAAASTDDTHLRSLAWSGVRAALAEVQQQRDALLDGGTPTLTPEWTLWERDDVRAVVRLLPVEGEGSDVIVSENARLDVNRADAAMLARLPGISDEVSRAIIAIRGSHGFASPAGIARAEGLGGDAFWGRDQAASEADPDASALVDTPPDATPLRHLVTTFSFDPDVRMGVSRESRSAHGRERLHVASGWSDAIRDDLRGTLSDAALQAIQGILSGAPPADERALLTPLLAAGTTPEVWSEVLDTLTTSDDAYRLGKVDLGRAPRAVLACLPGFDETTAERAVSVRGGLNADTLRNPAWLVTQGVLTPEQFVQAAPWVTTRSMVWRVRVEASIERSPLATGDAPTPLRRAVWEGVIDASGEQARLAEVTDVTHAAELLRRAREQAAARARAALDAPVQPPPPVDLFPPSPPRTPPARSGGGRPRQDAGTPDAKDQAGDGARTDGGTGAGGSSSGGASGGAPEKRDRRIGRWRGGGG